LAQRFNTGFGCAQLATKTEGGTIAAAARRRDGHPVGLLRKPAKPQESVGLG
jgi:hypothetical protein